MTGNDTDTIIIGGGAIGSAAAWRLARQGKSVQLFEQYEPGHRYGSSHGSSRVFRLAYPDRLYVAMAQAALPLWRELEREADATLLHTTGGVDHGSDVNVAGLHAALSRCGAACEVLTARAAEEQWPHMRFDGPVLYQPDAGRINADHAITALHDRARACGAELHFAEPVVDLHVRDDNVTVVTTAGSYRARTAVVAAGPWTPTLLSGLISLPRLRVIQAEVFHFPPTETAFEWPAFNHEAPGVAIYGVPTTRDGIKVAEHRTTGTATSPAARTFTIDPTIRARVQHYVQQWLPGLDPAVVLNETTCLYTMTRTEDFLIDRTGPLVIASPCSGHGFKFVPLIGQIVADTVTGAANPDRRFAFR